MSRRKRNPTNTEITDWERPQSKRKPPRKAEFRYKLRGQRFILKGPVAAVEAAMSARARVAAAESARALTEVSA